MKFKNMGRLFVCITCRAAGVRERRSGDILWQAYLDWYNVHRGHSCLGNLTPEEKYMAALPQLKLAA
ncbi:MAG: hypothetical protein NTW47_23025 [Proteobacteria bacterium]|nr:hypothetical protein [Pseudomonadota bacterium]